MPMFFPRWRAARQLRPMQRAAAWSLVAAGAVVLLVVATLAMPVEVWRTGRLPVPPLHLLRQPAPDGATSPVWIDTDPACGMGDHVDVDDCLAMWALARAPNVHVVGVSTVFGNRALDDTDHTARQLADQLARAGYPLPAVLRGADWPATADVERSPAVDGLAEALRVAPLTIVALGPLTNVAATLERYPDVRSRIVQIVAVMGRRPGHLFHPSEASGRGAFLGHGPVFRDFNFCADPVAAARVLRTNVPLTLVPYDAALRDEVTAEDLTWLARQDTAGAWVVERSRAWLAYWTTAIGRQGFCPFDLEAARFVLAPDQFRCADAFAEIAHDPLFAWPFNRWRALLVSPQSTVDRGLHRSVRYCPEANVVPVFRGVTTAAGGTP